MNKTIINENKICIVEDENGNKKEVEYSDNLENILIQENVIESLNNKKEILQKNIDKNTVLKNQKKKYHNKLKKVLVGLNLFTPISIYLICNNIGCSEIILKNFNGLSLTSLITAFSFSSTLLLSNVINQFDRLHIKAIENKLHGGIASLEYVNKDLEKQKENLSKLNNEKTYNNKNINERVLTVDSSEKLEVQRQYLELYYFCGFYYNNLLKKYRKGNLRKKMADPYNEEGLDAIEEYFKNHNEEYKPKRLIRKR